MRRARELAGLTQLEIAEAVGLSPASVSAWEKGSREPGLDALLALAARVGCQVGDFFPDAPVETIESSLAQRVTQQGRQLKTLRDDFYAMRDQLAADGLVTA